MRIKWSKCVAWSVASRQHSNIGVGEWGSQSALLFGVPSSKYLKCLSSEDWHTVQPRPGPHRSQNDLGLMWTSGCRMWDGKLMFWMRTLSLEYYRSRHTEAEVDVQKRTEPGKRFGGLFSQPDLHLRFRVWSPNLLSLKWWSAAVCPQPKFTSPPQLPAPPISSTRRFFRGIRMSVIQASNFSLPISFHLPSHLSPNLV